MNLPITEQTFSSSKPIDELGIKEEPKLIIKGKAVPTGMMPD